MCVLVPAAFCTLHQKHCQSAHLARVHAPRTRLSKVVLIARRSQSVSGVLASLKTRYLSQPLMKGAACVALTILVDDYSSQSLQPPLIFWRQDATTLMCHGPRPAMRFEFLALDFIPDTTATAPPAHETTIGRASQPPALDTTSLSEAIC